jgi:hypothetical protein
LDDVVSRAKDAGAEFVLAGLLTLKEEDRREVLDVLGEHFPELVPKYEILYKKSFYPPQEYNLNFARLADEVCKKYGVLGRIPRYFPCGAFKSNLKVSTQLFKEARDLEMSGGKYGRVLELREAAMKIEELQKDLRSLLESGGLKRLGFSASVLDLIMTIMAG